jgi:hypothetical protein
MGSSESRSFLRSRGFSCDGFLTTRWQIEVVNLMCCSDLVWALKSLAKLGAPFCCWLDVCAGYYSVGPPRRLLLMSIQMSTLTGSDIYKRLGRGLTASNVLSFSWFVLLWWGEDYVYKRAISRCQWHKWEKWVTFPSPKDQVDFLVVYFNPSLSDSADCGSSISG